PLRGYPPCQPTLQGVDDGELRTRNAQAPPHTWPDVVTVRAGSRDARDHRSHLRRRGLLRAGDRPRPGRDGLRMALHGPQLGGFPLTLGPGRPGPGRHRHAPGPRPPDRSGRPGLRHALTTRGQKGASGTPPKAPSLRHPRATEPTLGQLTPGARGTARPTPTHPQPPLYRRPPSLRCPRATEPAGVQLT